MPNRRQNDADNELENELGAENSPHQELLEHPSYQELMKKLDEAEQKASQSWERVLRMQADADNIQRRTERDIANAHKYALEKFVGELLPIIDSLELCITSVPKGMSGAESVVEGVKLTLKMFYGVLEKFGVTQVNPEGKMFDPEHEQAIQMEFNPDVQPGTVVKVLQKGYVLNNRLIRPALVIVAKDKE